MRIGFDISQTGRLKAGCGYMADSLVREFEQIGAEHEFLLYPTVGDLFWDSDWREATYQPVGRHLRRMLSPRDWAASRAFWSDPDGLFEKALGDPDVIHVNNFFAPRGVAKAKLVWTLHDLEFMDHPEWTEESNRTGCFEGVFGASLRADLIVSVSEYSRRRFLDVFPHFPEDRVEVVPLAARFEGPTDGGRPRSLAALEPGSFWLCVGTIQPRKNLSRVLEAWARLRESLPDSPALVLAGASGWGTDQFERALDAAGRAGPVIRTGYVDDEALRWLYENCFGFLHFALAEGFGLPVLEAMSLGAPVLCSNTTAMPEVAGDAALMCDPEDVEAICAVMRRLWMEPALPDRLRTAGFARAKQYSWRASARRLLDLYQDCLSRR